MAENDVRSTILLGIETSCDDTAAALVSDGRLLSSIVSSQLDHAPYGGVVPELASRAHQRIIVPVVQRALEQAGVELDELRGVAATRGPGLAGSLLVGLSFGKALALSLGIPFVGVNHLEGHIYSVFLSGEHPDFPFLCLIASGGHTELVRVDGGFVHTVLGRTRDDAAGEAFDKVAKLLGLGFPGGPTIASRAAYGDSRFQDFPRTRLPGYDYSFSGIKTSVLYYLNAFSDEERARHLEAHMDDLCASFQEAVVDMLVDPIGRAIDDTGIKDLAVVGGVSANELLRMRTLALTSEVGGRLFVPAPEFCTDNAAMIALAAYFRLGAGQTSPLTETIEPSLKLT